MAEEKNITPVEQEPVTAPEGTMRKYGTTTCKKCGTEYCSLYKECPHCGYSYTRAVLKVLCIVLCVACLAAGVIVNSMNIGKLQEDVETLKADLVSAQNSIATMRTVSGSVAGEGETVNITDLQYYNDQLIKDGMSFEDLPDDYLLYAHQDGCSACAEANEFVYAFLANGYPDYIPVYFITPQSNETLFFESLNCTDTPTLYRMSKGEIKETYVGVDDVYNGFDALVTEANEKYDASVAEGTNAEDDTTSDTTTEAEEN